MKDGINPIKIDADVERTRVPALSEEQIFSPMHKTLLEDERANYGSNVNLMNTIARREIRHLVAEETDHIYAERTKADVPKKIKEIFVDMLHLVNNAASN